jgi:hypothetical protein
MDKPHMPTIEERESASPQMQKQFALQCRHVKHLRRLSEARADAKARASANAKRDAVGKGASE